MYCKTSTIVMIAFVQLCYIFGSLYQYHSQLVVEGKANSHRARKMQRLI
jgi:hypothetical protein